jgi:hypothetical protein
MLFAPVTLFISFFFLCKDDLSKREWKAHREISNGVVGVHKFQAEGQRFKPNTNHKNNR